VRFLSYFLIAVIFSKKKKSKAISVPGHGGHGGYEMFRIYRQLLMWICCRKCIGNAWCRLWIILARHTRTVTDCTETVLRLAIVIINA
jgi:hypothetical protein